LTTLQVLTATTGNRHDCWNTPKEVIKDVLNFFDNNIDLDPCSNSHENPNVPASNLFTDVDNGLTKQWNYPSVFMNHPYSESKLWIPYAVEQHLRYDNEMLLLIKMDVSTKWWCSVKDYPFLAYNRRLRFGNSKSAAPFQSAMIYLGKRLDKFLDIFSKDGSVYSAL
jgi:phage N-6-adenine-methyltransferase